MADTVHFLLEESIKELEEYQDVGVFSKSELKSIIKKREDFEYRLKRRAALKTDFYRYIEFEKKLHELLGHRKVAIGVKGKKSIDTAIIRRIHFIFERATRKFKSDVQLWMDWLDYCDSSSSVKQHSKVVTKALQRHSDSPLLWIRAASWEFEKNGNVSAARSLMQQGLRMCKKDESMWSEYFRMELLYIQTLRIRRQVLGIDVPLEPSSMPQGDELGGEEAAANAVLSGAVAGIVIKGAFSALPDSFPIRQKLLDILSSFSFPGIDDLEEKVYASISSDFKGYEEAWRVLAMRPLRDWTKALQKDMDHKEGKVDPYPDPEIHTKVVSKFKVALTALNTSSMHDLFVSYLERHLDQLIKSQASKVASEEASTNGKKRSRGLKSLPKAPEPGPEPSDDVSSAGAELLGAYLSSFAAGSATESLCLRWIQRSEQLGQHRMASVASKKSCERYPGSVELWACRFHLAISHGGEEKATKKQRCSLSRSQELVSLLQEAIKSVPSSGSSSLWLMVLDEVCPSSEESRVGDGGSLFSKLIEMIVYAVTASKGKKGEEGGLGSVAAAFLQRIRVLQGLDAARSFYKRLLSLPSAGAAFLHVALDLEEDCGDHSSTSALHKLYEAAVSNHGSDDVELWLRYARFESKRIHGGLRSTSTGGIYWRACKALPSELHDAFIQKWKNEKI